MSVNKDHDVQFWRGSIKSGVVKFTTRCGNQAAAAELQELAAARSPCSSLTRSSRSLSHVTGIMLATPCDWAKGTYFLSQCEDDELVLNYADLALECIRAVLAACLAVAATRAWRHFRGEARTGHRSTVQAASTQTDLSFAAVSPAMAISFRSARSSASEAASSSRRARPDSLSESLSRSRSDLDPSIALAKATSHWALSKSDSTMASARAREVPPVKCDEADIALPSIPRI